MIQEATASGETSKQVPDQFVMQTPRPRALAIIHKALWRRDLIRVGPVQIRFCKRGDAFQEGETWLEARETGLYQRFSVYNAGTPLDHTPDSYTWMHIGDIGWFEELVNPILDQLSAYDRECALVDLTFSQVMREHQEERHRERHDGTSTASAS